MIGGVLEDFTASDHQYIFFSVQTQSRPRYEQPVPNETRFSTAKLNTDVFGLVICSGYSEMKRIGFGHRSAEDISLAEM